MKIHQITLLAAVGVLSLGTLASAQNRNIDTTATSVGSLAFGPEVDSLFLSTVMELDTTGRGIGCGNSASSTIVGAEDCFVSDGIGSNDAFTGAAEARYVRAAGVPGSFTDSPTPIPVLSLVAVYGGCTDTADFTKGCDLADPTSGTVFTANSTIPDVGAGRGFVGTLTSNISFATPNLTDVDGFTRFSINDGSGGGSGKTTIDQFLTGKMTLATDAAGDTVSTFDQRSATVLDPAAGVGLDNFDDDSYLLLATKLDANSGLTGIVSPEDGTLLDTTELNMLSRSRIEQGAFFDSNGNPFGAINIDVTVKFTNQTPQGVDGAVAGATKWPTLGGFAIPGLNTNKPGVNGRFAGLGDQAFP